MAAGSPAKPQPGAAVIHLLEGLTTGKASAQAAHGLWAWWLRSTGEVRDEWASLGSPVGLKFCNAEELEAHGKAWPRQAIRDAGLTEIAPKTLTAVTFMR